MDLVELWRNILGELEAKISRPNFVTWFKNTFILSYKKGVLTVGVPNFFAEDWLRKKHTEEIKKVLEKITGDKNTSIKYKVATPSKEQQIAFDKNKVIHNPVDNSAEKPTEKIVVQTLPKNTTLNNYYKFANFVVGPSNQLAYAAAEAVSKKPGTAYNPLFIYGESGLGKTHLMQAIGHAILEKEEKRILYVSSETFVNDFINAVEAGAGRAKDFKKRYRDVDILLIDDIHFISGKEQTQEEFFHTFNHLHQNEKQVVLTADRPPKAIKGLENRLKTRFEGGMVADITQPGLETKAAILKMKAKSKGVEVDDEIINFIAENIKSSIRELEGALTKVIANAEMSNSDITLENTKLILNNIIENRKQAITPDLIIRETCKFFHVTIEDLLGRSRTKEIVRPRQIVMYLLHSETSLSYPDIGREMGGKDHTTILHGFNKINRIISEDSRLKDDILLIKEKIRNSANS